MASKLFLTIHNWPLAYLVVKEQVQKDWASARPQELLIIVVAADKLNFSFCDAIGESGSWSQRTQKNQKSKRIKDCVPPKRAGVGSKLLSCESERPISNFFSGSS